MFRLQSLKLIRNGLKIHQFNKINKIRFSSLGGGLGSPMMPDRPSKVSDEELDRAYSDNNKNKKKKDDEEESFLTQHGGKVAIIALSIAALLIYKYFQGGTNRKRVEEILEEHTILEVYEMNELRLANEVTVEEYSKILNDHTWNYNGKESYINMLQKVRTSLGRDLCKTYLLDRLIFSICFSNIDDNNNSINDTTTTTTTNNNNNNFGEYGVGGDFEMDVTLFLFCIQYMIGARANERVESVKLLHKLSGIDDIQLLDYLGRTWQIPHEKRIIEIKLDENEDGSKKEPSILDSITNRFVAQQYRVCTAKDMYEKYLTAKANDKKEGDIAEEKEINLFGRVVCLWAECYRR